MSALLDDVGGMWLTLVAAQRGMTDGEAADFLATGTYPDLSLSPNEELPSSANSEDVLTPGQARDLLAGIPLTAGGLSTLIISLAAARDGTALLAAAGWKDELHPRDRHGKFINAGAVADLLSAKFPSMPQLFDAVHELNQKQWDDLKPEQRQFISERLGKLSNLNKEVAQAQNKIKNFGGVATPNTSKSSTVSKTQVLTGEAALAATPTRYSWNPKTDDWTVNSVELVPAPDVMEALDDYAGTGYKTLNGSLRQHAGNESKLTKAHSRTVAGLTKALNGSELKSDIRVLRGVKNGPGVFGDAWSKNLTGATWTEHGFTSTSANPAIATGFTGGADVGALMNITVPAGTRGVALGDFSDEAEIMLDRGLTLRVTADHGTVGKMRVLDVEVVKSDHNVNSPGAAKEVVPGGTQEGNTGATGNGLPGGGKTTGTSTQVDTTKPVHTPVVPAIIYKNNADGYVVAVSPSGESRMRWDAGSKKYVTEKNTGGAWQQTGTLTKTQAYQDVRDAKRWVAPDNSPNVSETPKVANVFDAVPVDGSTTTDNALDQAVKNYRGPAGQQMNADLRGWAPSTNPNTKKIQNALDAAMLKSRLTRDVRVHRGVENTNVIFGKSLPTGDATGFTWTDSGFPSTTINESQSTDFARLHMSPAVLNITVPKGTPAIKISDAHDEGELLLDRGLTFRVTHDNGVVNGRRSLDVEVTGKTGQTGTNIGTPAPPQAPKPAPAVVEPATKTVTSVNPALSPGLTTQEKTRLIQGQVLDAYRHAQAARPQRENDWEMISDVRKYLDPALSRAEVDGALVQLIRHHDVVIVPESNQKVLTAEQRAGAVSIGNQSKHLIMIEGGLEGLARTRKSINGEVTTSNTAPAHVKTSAAKAITQLSPTDDITQLRDQLEKLVPNPWDIRREYIGNALLRAQLPESHVYVSRGADGKLAGALSLDTNDPSTSHISYVAAVKNGTGAGTDLIREALQYTLDHHLDGVSVESSPGNSSRKFWEKAGFTSRPPGIIHPNDYWLYLDRVGIKKWLDGHKSTTVTASGDTSNVGEDMNITASGDEPHTGAAIMAKVSEEDSERLAVDGGEDAGELHMTLAYLGQAADITSDVRIALVTALVTALGQTPEVEAEIFSISLFNPNGATDGREPCVVGGVGGDQPALLHDTVMKTLDGVAGLQLPDQHTPWVPHVTLIYTDDADLGYFTDLVGPVTFDSVEIAFGDESYEIPLRELPEDELPEDVATAPGVDEVVDQNAPGDVTPEPVTPSSPLPPTSQPQPGDQVTYTTDLTFDEQGAPVAVPNTLFDYAAWAKERNVNAPPGAGHQLREYWVHGPGAAKIGWGTDGSFKRCVAELGKHVTRPEGLCAEYHHAATGEWPRGGVPSGGETIALDDVSTHDDTVGYATDGTATAEGDTVPWHLEKRGAQFCVIKDADSSTVACHDDRGGAVAQLRALYTSEPTAAALLNGGCPPGHHKMPDGTCMPDPEMPETQPAYEGTAPWRGVLTVEGLESGDGRMFAANSLTWDTPPLPLMWQKETSHGGKSDVSVRVGSIDRVWREADANGRPGVNVIMGEGTIDLGNPDGAEIHRRMVAGSAGGDSVDVDSVKNADVELVYPEVDPGDGGGDGALDVGKMFAQPELTLYHRGRIRGTTLVEFPAFTEASLGLVDADTVTAGATETFTAVSPHHTATVDSPWDAGAAEANLPSPLPVAAARAEYAWIDESQAQNGTLPKGACKLPHHEVGADGRPGAANLTGCSTAIGALHGSRSPTTIPSDQRQATYNHLAAHLRDANREPPPFSLFDQRMDTLTAATSVIEITDAPPREWFAEPTDVPHYGALTVTDEGRLYGWLAPAGVRHRSFADRSQFVPLGNVDYSRFMGGETIVADGGRVTTGTVTMDCGHASTGYGVGAREAADHYDNTCSIVATACVGESADGGGVWIAGALLGGVTAEQVQKIMACRLSGDWRAHLDRPGWREFVAALLVPVPGFPMARVAPSVSIEEGELVASAIPVRLTTTPGTRRRKAYDTDNRARAVAIAARLGRDRGSRVAALRGRLAAFTSSSR